MDCRGLNIPTRWLIVRQGFHNLYRTRLYCLQEFLFTTALVSIHIPTWARNWSHEQTLSKGSPPHVAQSVEQLQSWVPLLFGCLGVATTFGGFPKSRVHFWGAYNKDYSMLGYILHIWGNYRLSFVLKLGLHGREEDGFRIFQVFQVCRSLILP